MAKWYMACLMILWQRAEAKGLCRNFAEIAICGFEGGHSTDNIVHPLRPLAAAGQEWGNELACYIAAADVKDAFDSVTPVMAAKAMEESAVPARLVQAITRELLGNTCEVSFQDINTEKESLHFNKTIRQGGKEGPTLWNCHLKVCTHRLIKSWNERNFGVQIRSNRHRKDPLRITHLFWADNVYVVAENCTQMMMMLMELTDCLAKTGCCGKKGAHASVRLESVMSRQ
mmetsp:Transcript_76614/g.173276  ORF Transcript_76614/g.173276 Transcript_76614/m.173276 type:complete len:229 (-) Transcript_76614:25-711(-)